MALPDMSETSRSGDIPPIRTPILFFFISSLLNIAEGPQEAKIIFPHKEHSAKRCNPKTHPLPSLPPLETVS
jgi:hypothetical protein